MHSVTQTLFLTEEELAMFTDHEWDSLMTRAQEDVVKRKTAYDQSVSFQQQLAKMRSGDEPAKPSVPLVKVIPSSNKPFDLTFCTLAQSAEQVLRHSGEPLSLSRIVAKMTSWGYGNGKVTHRRIRNSVAAVLAAETLKGKYKRVSRGVYQFIPPAPAPVPVQK